MRQFLTVGLGLTLASIIFAQELTFVQAPRITKVNDTTYHVDFEISKASDVEVSIVSLHDSTIVRHLAAGVLGANPPVPFTANALQQTLIWNGKGDLGEAVNLPAESLSVRVRAGMSASLNQFVGNDPYRFYVPGTNGYWEFKGLVSNPDGLVYAYGSAASSGVMTVRAYDASGNYIRTVFPYPGDKPANTVSGFGILNWDDGKYSPKTAADKAQCKLSTLIIGELDNFNGYRNGQGATLMPVNESSSLFFLGAANKWMTISTDGSRSGSAVQATFITSPALPASDNIGGKVFLCDAPDNQNFYMSGLWEKNAAGAVGTGFWKDGQVFKVNKTTGVATPFVQLDSVPLTPTARSIRIGPASGAADCFGAYSAVHGLACDDSSRLYICDRHHARIGVYNTDGVFLGGIPVKSPDMVCVNSATGAVYVVSRNVTGWYEGVITLYKFNGWRNTPAPACSVRVSTDVDYYGSSAYLAVPPGQNQALVWVGHGRMSGMMIYRDDGSAFTLVKDLGAQSSNFLGGFDRLAVDRSSESVFINDGWAGIGRIEDWSHPEVLPCTLSNGNRLCGHDMAVSFDGQLYVQGPGSCGDSIHRFTLDHHPAPANYANTHDNTLTPGSWSHMGSNYGFKGFAVSPDKQVAVISPVDWPGRWCVGALADSGQTQYIGPLGCDVMPYEIDTLVDMVGGMAPSTSGGLKYDLQGNLYLGDAIRSRYHAIPSGFESDAAYDRGVGAIFKYPVNTRGRIMDPGCCSINTDAEANATGHERIYTPGFAPFSAAEACACRTPRFDVDLYGRLFIPNAFTQKIAVVDNNDNPILNFGEYGNYDAKGPAIPLCWPTGAAASDNYVYVTDFGNGRLVRVKMEYALNNMPGYGEHSGVAGPVRTGREPRMRMTATPNPFNPVVRITVSGDLKSAISLKVFDLSGKQVADLSANVLNGNAVWNAEKMASGVYVAVAQQGALKMVRKIIYSK